MSSQKTNVIVSSIIQKSQLEGAHRIDAEYYQPEYLNFGLLKKIPGDVLNDVAHCFSGFAFPSAKFSKPGEIPVIKMTEITGNGFVDFENVEGISKEFCKTIPTICSRFQVQRGDIVVALTGATIGKAGVVLEEGVLLNQRVLLCRAKKISKGYLWALLCTKTFQDYIVRGALGGAQPNVSPKYAVDFFVPFLGEAKNRDIENLTRDSINNFETSKSLYSQAENLLLEELELKNFVSENELWSVVNLSEVKKVNRIDAEYFQLQYEKLESKIKKHEHKLLEQVLENVSAKFDAMKQPEKSFKYVELSNINASIGIINGFSEVFGKEAPGRAKRVLKENDVIVSSIEGSLGKVALAHREQENFLASTGFFQFRSKEILPEVLLVLAKSIVFQRQLEKRCAGAILTAVSKESIKDVIVPILPKSTQQKIADLVQKSHESRNKANELLEEAKQKVEQLIESE